jgi:hypothetical protein
MDLLLVMLLAALAVLHLLPAVAAAAPAQLSRLYGVASDDAVLLTLLQHRAVLLGLVGLGFVLACFLPGLRWAALGFGLINMVSFIAIAAMRGTLKGPLNKIVVADGMGLPLAAGAGLLLAMGV